MNEAFINQANTIIGNKVRKSQFNEILIGCVFDCEQDRSVMTVRRAVYGKDIWGDIVPMLIVTVQEKYITYYCQYTIEHFIKEFGADAMKHVLDEIHR